MKNEGTYQVRWTCSNCNAQNRISVRRCPECGAEMPNEFLMDVYKYEIERQNRAYAKAKEEKNIRMVVPFVGVVAILSILVGTQPAILSFVFLVVELLAGNYYSNLTSDYMKKVVNPVVNPNDLGTTWPAFIIMMVAFLLIKALSDYTWPIYIVLGILLMLFFIGVNFKQIFESGKMFKSVIFQTVIMLIMILHLFL